MPILLKLDLRQIHGDTVRALSENRRKHDSLRVRILQLQAEAFTETRRQFGLSAHDIADMAGVPPDTVLEVERGSMNPPQSVAEIYIGISEGTTFAKMPKEPSPAHDGEEIHFLIGTRNLPKGKLATFDSACGRGVLLGDVTQVTCERCRATTVFKSTVNAINQSRKP